MPRYIHPHSLVPWELLYHATIYPPPLSSSMGVIISSHDTSTPTHTWDWYIYIYIYKDIIFSLLAIFGEGVIISWHYIFTPNNIWRGWLYREIIFSLLKIFGQGWLYRDIIFSLLAIFGEGVIILWHYIFTADNIWSRGDYIVTPYFHSWQYLVRGWLYCDIIFSLLAIFGEGVIISWHIFTPEDISWGGDYIVTWYFHSWQYLVRGWLYCDIIFSLLTIFGEGVIISWHIFTPEDIW